MKKLTLHLPSNAIIVAIITMGIDFILTIFVGDFVNQNVLKWVIYISFWLCLTIYLINKREKEKIRLEINVFVLIIALLLFIFLVIPVKINQISAPSSLSPRITGKAAGISTLFGCYLSLIILWAKIRWAGHRSGAGPSGN